MRQARVFLLASLAFLAAAGCQSVAPPNIYDPGPLDYQRSSAQRFDPYTDQEIGPDVVGGRPRDFDKPIAEPSRARWNPFTWANRWGF
jgi:hypothetical protein